MTALTGILVGSALLMVLVWAGWRLSSRRSSLPCPSWLGWMVELDNPLARNQNARAIIRQLELKPGMKVLDAGCGPGRVTIPLAQQLGPHGEVVAIDLQPEMLRRVEGKARAAGLKNVRCIQQTIGDGTLEESRFDRALLVTVLGEIPDRRAALREIYGLLTPGGILSITETVFDPHYQSRESIRRLAEGTGFTERSTSGNRLSFTMNLEKPV